MTVKYRADLVRGQKRAAAKRRRLGKEIDDMVRAAIAAGDAPDARALEARLGISYFAARRSLKRQGLWSKKTQ